MNKTSEVTAMEIHQNKDFPETNGNQNVSFFAIFMYCKKRYSRILWSMGLSFAAILLLILSLYCLSPRRSTYRLGHEITLQKDGDDFVYPNGKKFRTADLLSPLVLNHVYEKLGLRDYFDYSDFPSAFSFDEHDQDRMRIDAQFREKLSMRNLRLEDVIRLENDYKMAVKDHQSATVTIRMTQKSSNRMPEQKTVQTMYAVAESWFQLYSKLEAKPFPQVESAERMKLLKNEIGPGNILMPLEDAYAYCNSLERICEQLNELLAGRNVCLPSGEYLSDIVYQIAILKLYQINVFRNYVIQHPELYSDYDKLLFRSVLAQIEVDLTRQKARKKGIIDALDAISAKKSFSSKAAKDGGEASTISLQLDSGFFDSVANLIRNDPGTKMRVEYADRALKYGEATAKLEARKQYYQKIVERFKFPSKNYFRAGSIPANQLIDMVRDFFDEMIALNAKVIQFRDMILNDYVFSDQFYTVSSCVQVDKAPVIPYKKVAIGLIVLWLLCGCGAIAIDFYSWNKKAVEAK